jgi:hypothetical protein
MFNWQGYLAPKLASSHFRRKQNKKHAGTRAHTSLLLITAYLNKSSKLGFHTLKYFLLALSIANQR